MGASGCRLPAVFVLAAALTGCNDIGYVELKTAPATVRGPALYLDSERLERPKDGVAMLRQATGTRRLQAELGSGELSLLCEIVVRKDRITTVTVSLIERPPRCLCARTGDADTPGRRTCVG